MQWTRGWGMPSLFAWLESTMEEPQVSRELTVVQDGATEPAHSSGPNSTWGLPQDAR